MRRFLAASALLVLGCLALPGQARIPTEPLSDVLPPDAKVEQLTLTNDGGRT